MKNNLKIATGFVLLFVLYHSAEYFVLFDYNPYAFLSIQGLFFIAAYSIARWQGYSGLSAWGLSTTKGWLQQLLVGMLMGVLMYGLVWLICIVSGIEQIVLQPFTVSLISPLALFCFGNFFSSFSEDILTRGYVVHHLNKKIRVSFIVCISASVYVLNHVYRLTDGWVTYGYLFSLGLLFVIPLIITKRLWLTGGMHWLGNTTFFFTHNIMQTNSTETIVTANHVLIVTVLLFMPIAIFIASRMKIVPVSGSV